MSRISRKDIDKMTKQMGVQAPRGNTWCGFRSSTIKSKSAKYDKKARREEGKKMCACTEH